MADDDTKLLTKVNLNGTELIIVDTEARQKIEQGAEVVDDAVSSIRALYTRLTEVENKTKSFITATYDAQSQTLSLTSKS